MSTSDYKSANSEDLLYWLKLNQLKNRLKQVTFGKTATFNKVNYEMKKNF